jgi:cytolysin-activating lysine-acyltransferase
MAAVTKKPVAPAQRPEPGAGETRAAGGPQPVPSVAEAAAQSASRSATYRPSPASTAEAIGRNNRIEIAASAPSAGTAPSSAQSRVAGAQTAEQAAAGARSPGDLDKIGALGHAVWLMTQSPLHRNFFVSDLEWMLVPPVALAQFRLWRHENKPIGFVTWAQVSREVDDRLAKGERRLKFEDWSSGDRLWLMDIILPFGGHTEALAELKSQVFPGRKIKTLHLAPNGAMAVGEI